MNGMDNKEFCKRQNEFRAEVESCGEGNKGYYVCIINKKVQLGNCNKKVCLLCDDYLGLGMNTADSSGNNDTGVQMTHKNTTPTSTNSTNEINDLKTPTNVNAGLTNTSSNVQSQNPEKQSKIPEGLIIGGGIGVMVLFVLGFILIINFVRKRKNNDDGISKERNIPGAKGYDQLDDENYSSYRSFTSSSIQNPNTLIDNKPFTRTSSNDQMPIYDDVIIDKRNTNTQNNYNTSIIYNNENSIVMRNNFHGNESMKMNPNRSFSNGTNSEFHKVNTSILVDSLAETSFQKNPNVLDNTYGNKAVTKMGSREFSQKNMMIQSNEAVNSSSMFNNMNENANSSPNEIKQAFSNMPYSPTSLSNTSTSTSLNQKYYINGTNSIQSPANVYIITNQNSHNNPFSDSHVVSSPTNGYTYDLTLNQEQNQISKDGENDNINQNKNFNNISKNYSYRNEESFIKSPMNKQQTYVSSPPGGNNKNLMRNAITTTGENILRATSLSKQRSYTGAGTPNLTMNNNMNSVNNQSPSGYPSNSEHRYSGGKSIHSSADGTPNLSRSSSNKSHHSVITSSTPVIENIPSGKQTIEHHLSTKSIKTSTATIEKIPSSSQLHHKHSLNNGKPSESSDSKGDTSMVMSPTQIGKNPQTPIQPKSILKNSNSVSYNTSGVYTSQDDLNISHSISVKRKRSKSRKTTQTNDNVGSTVVATPSGDINIPPFPSMSRNNSGVLKGGDNNVTIESSSTTPSRPPTLTVYGHALETPPIPKSTRFPQDAMVLPPTVGVTPVPPDILGGTDVVPLNTMTLQRKHFHKKNKSLSAAAIKNDYSVDESMIKSKHPLPPVPPLPSNLQNNNKSNDDVVGTITKVNSVKEKERINRDQSPDTSHYRSKSLPRPTKNSSRYMEDQNILSSSPAIDPNVLNGLEQELTNFELDFYKENENQKVVKTKNKNSVLSILREERRNMEYYIEHCDD